MTLEKGKDPVLQIEAEDVLTVAQERTDKD